MKLFVAAIITLAACNVAVAENPFVEADAVFTGNKATLHPTVKLDGTSCTLANRGLIFSRAKYPKGMKLSFDWKWTEGRAEGAYQDVLTIAVRGNSGLREKWSYEIKRGVVVTLQAHSGKVTVERRNLKGPNKTLAVRSGLSFKRGQKYAVLIEDRDGVITVKVNQGKLARLVVPVPVKLKVHVVSIYNREPVAGVRKVSKLSKLSIAATK